MPFLHYDKENQLRASALMWIYPVLALPLTAATVWYWRYKVLARRRAQKRLMDFERAPEV